MNCKEELDKYIQIIESSGEEVPSLFKKILVELDYCSKLQTQIDDLQEENENLKIRVNYLLGVKGNQINKSKVMCDIVQRVGKRSNNE